MFSTAYNAQLVEILKLFCSMRNKQFSTKVNFSPKTQVLGWMLEKKEFQTSLTFTIFFQFSHNSRSNKSLKSRFIDYVLLISVTPASLSFQNFQVRRRTALAWVAAIVCFELLMLVIPAIPHSHDFADQREFFGIPNTLNVISNLPFFFAGMTGLVLCYYPDYFKLRLPGVLWGWTVFFIGVAAVGFGSFYYHLKPNDARLVWDCLPMILAFTSIITIFIFERVDEPKGTFSVIPLLLAGIVSILYRRFFYALVQFVRCVAIPVMAVLLTAIYTHSKYWPWAAGFYLLARIEEAADKPIYNLTRHIVSGHTLKHLCAAAVPVFLALMLAKWDIAEESFNSPNQTQKRRNRLNFIRGEKLLSDLSTWGIGGPCKYFVQVFDYHQLITAIRYCNEKSMRYIIIGKGSNCLFDDLGFDGCVILNSIVFLERIEPGLYRAGSGYPMNRLGVQSVNEGFSGLEFAGGIPGTVGGAAYMNAGANGQETADIVESVEIITTEGEHQILKRSDLRFGYRLSPFQSMINLAAITAVTFRLKVSQSAKEKQQEYLERRKSTQPLVERSAGSVFRNPCGTGFSAAQLIERVGLKGCKVGGAMISSKHSNFFINCGGATSQDMLNLIALTKEAVYRQFGVKLKEEIWYVHAYCEN